MAKRVLVVLGHPHDNSFCGGLAEAYARGAEQPGVETRLVRLSSLAFDPAGPHYKSHAPVAPDVQAFQQQLTWAEHIAFIYPIWWGAAPGRFKSLLESALLPGFAFKYHDHGSGWDKLLQGRTAECIVTMDTPPFLYRWFMKRAGDHVMAGRTLAFCGIKVRRLTHLGPIRTATPEQRQRWLTQAEQRGQAAAA